MGRIPQIDGTNEESDNAGDNLEVREAGFPTLLWSVLMHLYYEWKTSQKADPWMVYRAQLASSQNAGA